MHPVKSICLIALLLVSSFGYAQDSTLTKKQQRVEKKRLKKAKVTVDHQKGLTEGYLLYANATGMVIWKNLEKKIDPKNLDGNVVLIEPKDMITISRTNPAMTTSVLFGFLGGVGVGVVISAFVIDAEEESAWGIAVPVILGTGAGYLIGEKKGGKAYNEPIDGNSDAYTEILPKVNASSYYKENVPAEISSFISKNKTK